MEVVVVVVLQIVEVGQVIVLLNLELRVWNVEFGIVRHVDPSNFENTLRYSFTIPNSTFQILFGLSPAYNQVGQR